MPLPNITERFAGAVNRLTIGATASTGGTRRTTVTVGGATDVVYGGDHTGCGDKPVLALDVLDVAPADWPEPLVRSYQDVLDDPAAWARKCVDQFGADLICLKFDGVHPDRQDKGADHAVKVTRSILAAVPVPLILWGCGNDEKDNQVLPKVSEAAKGEQCLLGTATEKNYKALTAVALADGHLLIGEAPLDINIAKQVNILMADMGFPADRIVNFQTTGSLGYGIEYAYSIQERQRLAALSGDKMMAMPIICDVGAEAWRAKEAKATDVPQWGASADRGPMWEAATAICLLQAGADILRMRHPRAVKIVRKFIDQVWA